MIVFTLEIGRRSSFIFAEEACVFIMCIFDRKIVKQIKLNTKPQKERWQ